MPAIGQNILQALLQRGTEQRAGKKREDRIRQVTDLFTIVHGKGTQEEKAAAAGELAALGVPVSQKLLKPDIDASDLFEALNLDEDLYDSLNRQINSGNMTLVQALDFAEQSGDGVNKLSDDNIRKLFDAGHFQGDLYKGSVIAGMTSPDQIIAHIGFQSAVVKRIGVEGTAGLLSAGKQAKPTTTEEKIALVQKYTTYEDGSQVPIELLLPDEERMLGLAAGGMNRAAVMASYNVDTKAIESAERSIKSEVMASSVLLLMDLGGYLDAYAKGTEDAYIRDKNGEIQKHKQVAMNIVKENYNKSGEIRMALVKERADKSLQLAIENSASVGNLEAAGLPIRMQGYMQTIMEIEADSGERVTKSMVRKWMKEDSQLPGYNLTPEQEEQFLSYFEE